LIKAWDIVSTLFGLGAQSVPHPTEPPPGEGLEVSAHHGLELGLQSLGVLPAPVLGIAQEVEYH